jgi:hypothetical protein
VTNHPILQIFSYDHDVIFFEPIHFLLFNHGYCYDAQQNKPLTTSSPTNEPNEQVLMTEKYRKRNHHPGNSSAHEANITSYYVRNYLGSAAWEDILYNARLTSLAK